MTGNEPPRYYGGQFGPKPDDSRPARRKVRSQSGQRPNLYRGRKEASAYQRKARELKASPDGQFCWICGGEIDRSLPSNMYNDPRYFTVDHDPPLSQGGSLLEGLRPAHKGCNSAAGRAMQTGRPPEGFRSWDNVLLAADQPIVPDPRTGGFTRANGLDLNPDDPGYVEHSRRW